MLVRDPDFDTWAPDQHCGTSHRKASGVTLLWGSNPLLDNRLIDQGVKLASYPPGV